ncbi:response regulator [Magnetococcales bacterium HHB-1]
MVGDSTEAFDALFAEENTPKTPSEKKERWKILIVDDDKEVHDITKLALKGVVFQNRTLHFLHAYSAKEAREIFAQHNDIALILLDVVMEEDNAGLSFVQTVRQEFDNSIVRIVLRTGQPGHAPERRIILEYDINDYKTKTELTDLKLFTTVIAALRSYQAHWEVVRQKQILQEAIRQAEALEALRLL